MVDLSLQDLQSVKVYLHVVDAQLKVAADQLKAQEKVVTNYQDRVADLSKHVDKRIDDLEKVAAKPTSGSAARARKADDETSSRSSRSGQG
jgi:Cu2+-containing amine oxidase